MGHHLPQPKRRPGHRKGEPRAPAPSSGLSQQLRGLHTCPVFPGPVSLPGHQWPLQAYAPLLGEVGSVSAAPGARGQGGPGLPPARLPGAQRGACQGSGRHAPSRANKVPVAGKRADSWGPGCGESSPGSGVHTTAPPCPSLWPGPVVGTGPAPTPFLLLASSGNQPPLQGAGISRARRHQRSFSCVCFSCPRHGGNGQLSPCPDPRTRQCHGQ